MSSTVKLPQTKAIGWYAVQRVRISDWLKPKHATSDKTAAADQSSVQTDTTSYGQTSKKQKEASTQSDTTANTKQEKDAKDQSSEQASIEKPSATGADAKKLKAVVKESHTILVKAQSVFPLQLFPDSVNVDRHKLTIIRRQFFGVEQKVSVPIENIKNIEADLGPFFGSITVTSDLFINNTQDVKYLWRDDAKKIQKLVQGAVVAQTENIDLNKIEVDELRSMLIDLGSGHTKSM